MHSTDFDILWSKLRSKYFSNFSRSIFFWPIGLFWPIAYLHILSCKFPLFSVFPNILFLLILNLTHCGQKMDSVRFKSFWIYWDLFYGTACGLSWWDSMCTWKTCISSVADECSVLTIYIRWLRLVLFVSFRHLLIFRLLIHLTFFKFLKCFLIFWLLFISIICR